MIFPDDFNERTYPVIERKVTLKDLEKRLKEEPKEKVIRTFTHRGILIQYPNGKQEYHKKGTSEYELYSY